MSSIETTCYIVADMAFNSETMLKYEILERVKELINSIRNKEGETEVGISKTKWAGIIGVLAILAGLMYFFGWPWISSMSLFSKAAPKAKKSSASWDFTPGNIISWVFYLIKGVIALITTLTPGGGIASLGFFGFNYYWYERLWIPIGFGNENMDYILIAVQHIFETEWARWMGSKLSYNLKSIGYLWNIVENISGRLSGIAEKIWLFLAPILNALGNLIPPLTDRIKNVPWAKYGSKLITGVQKAWKNINVYGRSKYAVALQAREQLSKHLSTKYALKETAAVLKRKHEGTIAVLDDCLHSMEMLIDQTPSIMSLMLAYREKLSENGIKKVRFIFDKVHPGINYFAEPGALTRALLKNNNIVSKSVHTPALNFPDLKTNPFKIWATSFDEGAKDSETELQMDQTYRILMDGDVAYLTRNDEAWITPDGGSNPELVTPIPVMESRLLITNSFWANEGLIWDSSKRMYRLLSIAVKDASFPLYSTTFSFLRQVDAEKEERVKNVSMKVMKELISKHVRKITKTNKQVNLLENVIRFDKKNTEDHFVVTADDGACIETKISKNSTISSLGQTAKRKQNISVLPPKIISEFKDMMKFHTSGPISVILVQRTKTA